MGAVLIMRAPKMEAMPAAAKTRINPALAA
jgi:hypothetical protein